jgi:hypothetical protein
MLYDEATDEDGESFLTAATEGRASTAYDRTRTQFFVVPSPLTVGTFGQTFAAHLSLPIGKAVLLFPARNSQTREVLPARTLVKLPNTPSRLRNLQTGTISLSRHHLYLTGSELRRSHYRTVPKNSKPRYSIPMSTMTALPVIANLDSDFVEQLNLWSCSQPEPLNSAIRGRQLTQRLIKWS